MDLPTIMAFPSYYSTPSISLSVPRSPPPAGCIGSFSQSQTPNHKPNIVIFPQWYQCDLCWNMDATFSLKVRKSLTEYMHALSYRRDELLPRLLSWEARSLARHSWKPIARPQPVCTLLSLSLWVITNANHAPTPAIQFPRGRHSNRGLMMSL